MLAAGVHRRPEGLVNDSSVGQGEHGPTQEGGEHMHRALGVDLLCSSHLVSGLKVPREVRCTAYTCGCAVHPHAMPPHAGLTDGLRPLPRPAASDVHRECTKGIPG